MADENKNEQEEDHSIEEILAMMSLSIQKIFTLFFSKYL